MNLINILIFHLIVVQPLTNLDAKLIKIFD